MNNTISVGEDLASHSPLAWAECCRSRAISEPNVEAQSALLQLAEEFEAVAFEIEGLVSGFEALVRQPLPPAEAA